MFETVKRLLLKRISENTDLNTLISNQQFSFRKSHSTVEQCHTIVKNIVTSFTEIKIMYSGLFEDSTF